MPGVGYNIDQFSITPLASASVNVPRAQVEGRLLDDATGAVIADFTGANAVIFPNVLSNLTAAERLEVLNLVINYIILKRFGAA